MRALKYGTRVEWGTPPTRGTVIQQDDTEVIIQADHGTLTVLPVTRLRPLQ